MPALTLQFAQLFLLQLRCRDHWRLHRLSKSTEYSRIDRIGLGQDPSRSSKGSHPIGWHQTDFDLCPNQRLDKPPLLAAAVFSNHLRLPFDLLNPLDKLPMTHRIVGQTTLLFFQ